MRGFITFIVVFVLLFVVAGLFGANVGPYEILLALVIAILVAVASARMRRRRPRKTP